MLELSIIFFKKIISNDMDESLTDKLIEHALNIAAKCYKKEEIINILNNEDELEKPLAIIAVENVTSYNEADLLINHLTGCDGRIREASALKISEFLSCPETAKYFLNENSIKTILNGIMDINPNVGRALIEGIKECEQLQMLLQPLLVERIEEIITKLKEIAALPFKENKLNNRKNHAKNKIMFNLYWALEALYYTDVNNITSKLYDILSFTSSCFDYTIREKSAKILSKMESPPSVLLHKLKNDENFYVKNQLLC